MVMTYGEMARRLAEAASGLTGKGMDMNAQTITGIVIGIILGGLLLLVLKEMQDKSLFAQILMLIFLVLPLAFAGWCVISIS